MIGNSIFSEICLWYAKNYCARNMESLVFFFFALPVHLIEFSRVVKVFLTISQILIFYNMVSKIREWTLFILMMEYFIA